MKIAHLLEVIYVRMNRRRGIYPQKGQATIADVKRLISKCEKTLATYAYCELNHINSAIFSKERQEVEKRIKNRILDSIKNSKTSVPEGSQASHQHDGAPLLSQSKTRK